MRTLQTAPYIPTSMVRNMKKEELNERRYTEIEKANRILLERMTTIMSHSAQRSTFSGTP